MICKVFLLVFKSLHVFNLWYFVYFYSKLFKVKGAGSNEAQVTVAQYNLIAINNVTNRQAEIKTNTWNHVYLRVCTCKSILVYFLHLALKKETLFLHLLVWRWYVTKISNGKLKLSEQNFMNSWLDMCYWWLLQTWLFGTLPWKRMTPILGSKVKSQTALDNGQ